MHDSFMLVLLQDTPFIKDTLLLKRLTRIPMAIVFSVIVSGCAGLATRLPDIPVTSLESERVIQENLAFEVYDDMAARLLDVGYPILVANAELCPSVKPDIGAFTHSLNNYRPRLKLAAARELGAGLDPHIFHVKQSGPAGQLQLKRGDIIRNEGGLALKLSSIRRALDRGEPLFLDRDNTVMSLTLKPDTACNYNLILKHSTAVNAYVDGRNINVTTGMMDFVRDDSELAMVIGHELAHNAMGHIRKVVGNLILSGFATRYTRPFESEADYIGLYYAKRAGYDISGVEDFWRRMAKRSPKNVGRAKTHPTFPTRYLRLSATREEIEAKLQNQDPLIPNFLADGRPSSLSVKTRK